MLRADFDFLTFVEFAEFGQFVAAAEEANCGRNASEEDETEQQRHRGAALRPAFFASLLGFGFVLAFEFRFRRRLSALADERGAVGGAELEAVVQVHLEEGNVGHTFQYAQKTDSRCGDESTCRQLSSHLRH